MGSPFVNVRSAAVLLAFVGMATAAHAQCTARWQPFDASTVGFAGASGPAGCATFWDPDGPGPAGSQLVVGGSFAIVGNTAAHGIAMYDLALHRWMPIGAGSTTQVHRVVALPSGNLVTITSSPGVVRMWNGSTWIQLGESLTNAPRLYALEATATGEVLLGGRFGAAAGNMNVAKLVNGAWESVGTVGMEVFELKVRSNGNIVASGYAGPIMHPITYIKEWDGQSWTTIGEGGSIDGASGAVRGIDETPSGDLIAAGTFQSLNGTDCYNAGRWDGAAWSPMPLYRPGQADPGGYDIVAMPDGGIIACYFDATTLYESSLVRWSGDQWDAFGPPITGSVSRLLPLGDESVLAMGTITAVDGRPVGGFAVNTGAAWETLGDGVVDGMPTKVSVLHRRSDGTLILAGERIASYHPLINSVWSWDGDSWAAVGDSPVGSVYAVAELSNHDLLAAGAYSGYNPTQRRGVARWDGVEWTQFGTPIIGAVNAMLTLPGDQVVVGGQFTFTNASGVEVRNLAKWSGTEWSPIGGGVDNTVHALARLPNGEIVVGGAFLNAGSLPRARIASWNGTTWIGFGAGLNDDVRSLLVRSDGSLVAGGEFTQASGQSVSGVVRWSAGEWQPMPGLGAGAVVNAIMERDNAELIAAGDFTISDASAGRSIARWNGSAWESMAATDVLGVPFALADDGGEIIVAGNFGAINGIVAPRIARLSAEPFVRDHPVSTSVYIGDDVELRARPGVGFSGVSVQWLHNGVEVANGPAGASAGGGVVTGAGATMPSPTDDNDAVLMISNAQVSDSGEYVAVFSSACGEASSHIATVLVEPVHAGCATCAADYDRSGSVDAADIGAFFADFETGADCADVNYDGGVDNSDLGAFFDLYEAGGC